MTISGQSGMKFYPFLLPSNIACILMGFANVQPNASMSIESKSSFSCWDFNCKIIRRTLVNLVSYTFGTNSGEQREISVKSAVTPVNRDYSTKIKNKSQRILVLVVAVLDIYIDFLNGFTFNVWNWMFFVSGVSIQLCTLSNSTIGHWLTAHHNSFPLVQHLLRWEFDLYILKSMAFDSITGIPFLFNWDLRAQYRRLTHVTSNH